MKLKVSTNAFSSGKAIPAKYSCDGTDFNPEIMISGIPEKTASLALIVDDPDAPGGVWTHWVVWNIPVEGKTKTIQENSVPGVQGTNSAASLEFHGPCPPSGTHKYYFKVYALDSNLSLKEGSTKTDLEKAMKGRLLAQGELMGTYQRE
ncbi:MAG: YbhB/YbcL family Raf kinase inhibitor-like protein [archaeon]